MAEAKRKFYLVDVDTGDLGGSLGLGGEVYEIPRTTGLIPAKLYEANLDELERRAATPRNPVTEGEPEGVK